jgi:hypothetical protein
VEGLLPLVVADQAAGVTAGAEGIDLVDEDNGRRPVAGLLEQVSYPGGAHAHK